MTVCCQNLTLGGLSNRSMLSMLVGALFKKFGLFLNMPLVCTPLFGGQQGSVQHKVAGCYDICQGAHLVHHQRHWVCVTSALEHTLYNDSACMHTPLVTVAQFQLLHNLSPPPWSQCHFLTHNCCCPQSVQISDLVQVISLSS